MMGNMTTDSDLATEFVGARLPGSTLTPLTAMNSSTWAVDANGKRFVLKIAAATDEPGLHAAVCLESRGIRTGAPLQIERRDDRSIALLRFVDGTALVASDAPLIGATLGKVHVAIRDCPTPSAMDVWPWGWLDTARISDPELGVSAAEAVHRALDLAPLLTHGILHGDPAPEAFLATDTDVALIDWGASCHGPLLYDVASAVMYAGRDVVTGYRTNGPLDDNELEHVDVFRALRWAVQAIYFSGRIAADDLTGIADASENEKGLEDARAGLANSLHGETISER
jgi:homoserine kinase type II